MKRVYKNWLVRVTVGFAAITGIRLISTLFHMTTLEKLYKPRDFRKTSHLEIDQKIIKSLPQYCHNIFGEKMDPINLIFVGDDRQIRAAFKRAGWNGVHPNTPLHWVYTLWALISRRHYGQGPFMPLFVNIGLQDLSFQQVSRKKFSERHHIRLWRTRHEIDGRRLWVSAATHETGFKILLKPPFVAHKMTPDLDYERDYVTDGLLASGCKLAASPQLNTKISTSSLKKNPHGDPYYTDGKANIIEVV
jgi:hypothetical protein